MRMFAAILGGVLLVSASALSGCASGYQYIKNDEMGVYARVPEGWAVYGTADLRPGDTERELERLEQVRWVRTFHGGDGQHDVQASVSPSGPVPAGGVLIEAISPERREVLDLRTMRGGGNAALDPIMLESQPPADGSTYTVLQDEPVEFDGGYSGIHTIWAVTSQGQTFITEQTVLRDAPSTRMFLFTVSCDEQCYFETYKDQIQDFVDSWTIQEVPS
jgi:hypothetical protein